MKKTASIVLVLLLCVGVMFIPVSASGLEESDSGSSGPNNVNATKYISPQEQLEW